MRCGGQLDSPGAGLPAPFVSQPKLESTWHEP